MNWDDAGHQLPDDPNATRCRFCGIICLCDVVQYPVCTFQAERFYAQWGLPLLQVIVPGYKPMIHCTAQPDEIMLSVSFTGTTFQTR